VPIRRCEVTPSAYAYPLLIRQLLRSGVAIAPQQEIVHADRRLTYRRLEARIGCLGAALSRLGVGEGTTVAVMDWDSHRYLECFFAVPMLGAVLMTVNVRLAPDQIAYTIDHSEAEVLIVHEDFAPLVPALLAAVSRIRRVIWASDAERPDAVVPAGDYRYEALIAAAPGEHPWSDFDENAMATVFYTTGTTGLPKAVAFSHRQIVLKVLVTYGAWAAQAPGQAFRQGDVYMPITPMFHVQAWSFPYVALLLGVKQVYPGKYDAANLLRLRREEGVTFSHCVPTLLDMLLRAENSLDTDLSGWKVCVGGASLSQGLARAALERGMDVFAGYGLSETYAGTLLTGFAGDQARYDTAGQIAIRCKAGRALPLVDLRVVDPEMRDVANDDRTVGELVVRMPWAVQGYLGMAEASERLWEHGYLHTQDLATIDDAGYVTIVDRLKDVIKSGGEWISSLELESLLTRHDDVAEAAVIAVADARWGERPLALVVPTRSAPADLAERLKAYLQQLSEQGRLSRFAVPERVEIVASLARTSVGKLDKKALREAFAR